MTIPIFLVVASVPDATPTLSLLIEPRIAFVFGVEKSPCPNPEISILKIINHKLVVSERKDKVETAMQLRIKPKIAIF